MKARCIFTALKDIADKELYRHVCEYVHLDEIDLVIGQIYLIEGVIFRNDVAWYLICDEVDADYPTPACSVFFDLVDPTVPPNWQIVPENPAYLVPAEWAAFPYFYEKLIDGDPAATAAFTRFRAANHNS